MDTGKFYEFFQPEKVKERIHIIGCGAVGSLVAETLTRMGLKKITLYDFDFVTSHNIANQLYVDADIGKRKTDALAKRMIAINPEIESELKICENGYEGQNLNGYVFLCVDSIELRREIAGSLKNNPFIKGVFDFRMRLTDGQHFAAKWSDKKAVQSLLNSMAFTDEEAKAETPVSACNLTLSVIPTVWMLVSVGVANFINMATNKEYRKIIYTDAFRPNLEAY